MTLWVRLCGRYSWGVFNCLNRLGNAQLAVIRVAVLQGFTYNESLRNFNRDQGCWPIYRRWPLLRGDRYEGFHCTHFKIWIEQSSNMTNQIAAFAVVTIATHHQGGMCNLCVVYFIISHNACIFSKSCIKPLTVFPAFSVTVVFPVASVSPVFK